MLNNPMTVLNRTNCFEIADIANRLVCQIEFCKDDIESINRQLGGAGRIRSTITGGRLNLQDDAPNSGTPSPDEITELHSRLEEKERELMRLKSKLDDARAEFRSSGCSAILPFPG